jgi:hypothetical protein
MYIWIYLYINIYIYIDKYICIYMCKQCAERTRITVRVRVSFYFHFISLVSRLVVGCFVLLWFAVFNNIYNIYQSVTCRVSYVRIIHITMWYVLIIHITIWYVLIIHIIWYVPVGCGWFFIWTRSVPSFDAH